jgi:hypothetical protein
MLEGWGVRGGEQAPHHGTGAAIGDRRKHCGQESRLHRAVLHVNEKPCGSRTGLLGATRGGHIIGRPHYRAQKQKGSGGYAELTVVARVRQLLSNCGAVAVHEETELWLSC